MNQNPLNSRFKGFFVLIPFKIPFFYQKKIKHFGNDCNVMAEILISRYEQFVENNSVTHITTNLSASELENSYGNRVRSRLRQMFNLIAFDKEARDKR